MNGTQPKNTAFSGCWKVDISEIMWVLLKSSQARSECFVFAAAAAVIGLPPPLCSLTSLRWPAVVQPSSPSSPSPGHLQPYGGKIGASWREVLNTRDGQCSESKKTTTHTHTLALCLEVSSQVTPNVSHSGGVKRSAHLLCRGSLSVSSPHTHTHTKWNRQRETEFVPSHLIYLSTNWTQSPLQCVVSAYKEL